MAKGLGNFARRASGLIVPGRAGREIAEAEQNREESKAKRRMIASRPRRDKVVTVRFHTDKRGITKPYKNRVKMQNRRRNKAARAARRGRTYKRVQSPNRLLARRRNHVR